MKKRHSYRTLWRLAHTLAIANSIDLTQGEPAYLSLLKFVPANELYLWPVDLKVYSKFDQNFFTPPAKQVSRYHSMDEKDLRCEVRKMVRELAKSERLRREEKLANETKVAFLETRIDSLTNGSRPESQRPTISLHQKELDFTKAKLSERETELSAARAAAANFEAEVVSLKLETSKLEEDLIAARSANGAAGLFEPAEEKSPSAIVSRKRKRNLSNFFDGQHEPYFGGKTKGICLDILSIKDLATPAMRETAMEERERTFVKVGDRYYYSHDMYLRLAICNELNCRKEYAELLLEIKNPDVRRMYPRPEDLCNIYLFPSRFSHPLQPVI